MFIEQAFRGKHDFWIYLVGSLIVALAAVIGQIPLTVAIFLENGWEASTMSQSQMMQSLDPNLLIFLLLLSFAVGFIGLKIALKYLHHINFMTITTTRKKVDWGRILLGFGLIAVFSSVSILIDYQSNPENYVWNFKPIPFLILCLIAIVMVPIQTSIEEYLFRGYLMQGFGVLAKNKWFPLMMTSIIFGLLHIANPEVDKLGYLILFFYIGTGLFLGIITLMDEGMELALGFHAGNNLVGIILVTANWTAFQSESLLKDVAEPTIGFDVFLPLLIVYPIFFIIMAKTYKWKNWKEKLFGKVETPAEIIN